LYQKMDEQVSTKNTKRKSADVNFPQGEHRQKKQRLPVGSEPDDGTGQTPTSVRKISKSKSKGKSSTRKGLVPYPVPYVCSWTGYEDQRDEICRAAIEIRDSDLAVRSLFSSNVVASAHILRGVRDISTSTTPEVARAAKAQLAMRNLVSDYRDKFNLDVMLMRCEASVIVDPSESNRAQMEQSLAWTREMNKVHDADEK